MQVVSVDIMHPPIYLENTSPLDLETDHPPLDNNTDPPSLYLETDHPPLDNKTDPPLYLETDHPPLDNETDPPSLDNETDPTSLDVETDPPPLDHPCPEANHSPVFSDLHADQPHCQEFQTSHPPAQGFLANHPSIGLRFTDVKTESSSDITTKVGSL